MTRIWRVKVEAQGATFEALCDTAQEAYRARDEIVDIFVRLNARDIASSVCAEVYGE